MNKKTRTILIMSIILGIGMLVFPLTSNAVGEGVIQSIGMGVVNNVIAVATNFFLGFTASIVTITGIFLSISISVTTHIDQFSKGIDGIGSIWTTIRDLSSIFIIFALLYFSIKTILGMGGNSMNQLIVKIFLAGILINFSLFFVRVAVDASNLISLQFYNAIVPNAYSNDGIFNVSSAINNGSGLSEIFMQSLKIPQIYNNQGLLKTADIAAGIGFATMGGIIMMVVAALSFLAASVAFTARTAILLALMALSPIFFVGMIFPEIKSKVSDKMLDQLKNQCIFMPVYLFLLYVSLRIISSKAFMAVFDHTSAGADQGLLGPVWISTIIQFAIAIIFINLPLFAAIQMGGVGMKWAPNANTVGKWFGGVTGRNIVGRAARGVGKSFDNMAAQDTFLGSSILKKAGAPIMRWTGVSQALRGGLKKGEEGKYGGSINLGGIDKANKERARTVSGVQRTGLQRAAIGTFMKAYKTGRPTTAQIDELKNQVKGMDQKELEAVDTKILTDPKFAIHIPTSKFESLVKSESLTPQQQQDLRKAREDGFREILNPAGTTAGSGADQLINQHLKGKPQDIAKLPSDIITMREVAKLFDPAMLRKMVDENVSKADRDQIRSIIDSYVAPTPNSTIDKSQKYLNTNFVF